MRSAKRVQTAVVTGLALVTLTGAATAGPIFSDNFNAENSGAGALNYSGLANWTVTDGTVDLIGNGYFDFYPGQGLYLDLDGSTGNAGRVTSIDFNLDPGVYELTFKLGGNARGAADDAVTLSFAGLSESFVLSSSQSLTTYTRTVSLASAIVGRIEFNHAGGDNMGIILDDVSISAVPSPAGGIFMGFATGMFLIRRRR